MNEHRFFDTVWGMWVALFLFSPIVGPGVFGIVATAFVLWLLYLLVKRLFCMARTMGQALRESRQRAAARKEQERCEKEWQRQQPIRDATARAVASAQRHREDARVAAEVLYALHQHAIGDTFPRTMFDEFVAKYMGDDRDPDYVLERSQQLQDVMHQLLDQATPVHGPTTVEELEKWHAEQKAVIGRSSFDDETKEVQLLLIDKRLDDLFKRIIQGDRP